MDFKMFETVMLGFPAYVESILETYNQRQQPLHG